jgi:hypothetical protein
MISDPLVMPLARELLECYRDALADHPSPPAHVGLRPGTTVDFLLSSLGDDECCEGLGWVRPDTFYPSSNAAGPFPAQDEAPTKQGVLAWAVTLELGAVRCAPTPGPEAIPSNEEWDTTTQAVMDDAAAMRRAICCFIERKQGRKQLVLPGIWQPVQVQGGCVGGILPVTVRGPVCDCVEPSSS